MNIQVVCTCMLTVFMLMTCGEGWLWSELPLFRPCGDDVFYPANQSCCESTVVNMPQRYCQCCGQQCYRPEEKKPDSCVRNCSGQVFHPNTQLCCEDNVREARSSGDKCCGKHVINTRHQRCCGHNFAVPKKEYRCCGPDSLVYHNDTMRCKRHNSTSKVVTLRNRFLRKFQSQDVCKKQLPTWDLDMPLPRIRNGSHIHIRGLPELCSIDSGTRRIEISLRPYAVVGQSTIPQCTHTDSLLIKVRLGATGQHCAGKEELQTYFSQAVLDLYCRKHVRCDESTGRLVLIVRDNDNTAIFLSQNPSDILMRSMDAV